jgi:hypothetical protein
MPVRVISMAPLLHWQEQEYQYHSEPCPESKRQPPSNLSGRDLHQPLPIHGEVQHQQDDHGITRVQMQVTPVVPTPSQTGQPAPSPAARRQAVGKQQPSPGHQTQTQKK